jgi:predicted RNA-binding Zn ribbon-like protein
MQTDWHALEFTKTRGWESRDRSDDDLVDFDGLVSWCERRGILSKALSRHFRRHARGVPAPARAAVDEARALRELIYKVLRAVGTGAPPTREQLRQVTAWAQRYAGARRLVRASDHVTWDCRLDGDRPDHLLAPIVWSLAELLVSPELARVRLCDGDDCGWLFVDGSKAHSRRWCDMSDCGNRAKVSRFRARKRSTR